ncbi:Insulin-degrading enzyme-like 1, peroxisomal [Actinidia chinensis var. chinensis]|uniref:Insulin-degrading enzyme-like 1, peroxisomal n=1 Tax=Actinidia chinensis var. chinensis TaxID=1590841 RepID=A0A2R6QVB5_ACTCC|nr:Insulin-degrading enzyme-like 1, peroxisomal [Actinidia chinensis var. chinensis]
MSKKFEETDMSEPWYGTPYSIEKIADSEIKHWMESALDERLRLPAPNAFIPPDFSRKTDRETSALPFLLRSRESRGETCHPHHIRLWYKPDTMFFTPKADVKIDFNCPYARSSPEATILNSIFTNLLVNDLIKYETDMSEPWYGTPYSIEKLADSEIKHWMESDLDERLRLPAPNAFIPPDFSRKTDREMSVLPFLLRSRESRGEICHPHHIRLWYKPDTMFFTPKADVKIDFNCPYARSSPEATILNSIFTNLLVNDLIKYADYARVAGLGYMINETGNGFEVSVHGFNHKLRTFLEIMVKKIAKFEVRDEKFHLIKEMVTNQGKNIKSRQPCDQALFYLSIILKDGLWHWNDFLKVLSRLKADNVTKFVHQLLSRTFIECYISGNIARDEALSIIQYIEDVFFTGSQPISEAVFSSELSTNRVTNLQQGISYFYPVKGLNSSDEISALVHYIQVHQDDFMLNVKLQLFTLMINEPFIRQLGSEEQVGYTVMSMLRIDSAIYGVQFIVQSIRKGLSPGRMNLRVVEFLKWLESKIYKMSRDEFEKRVDSLIHVKLRKPQNLMEESVIYWKEIVDGTLKFDRREREVAALKQLTKEDFIAFFDEYIKVGAPRKKTLSVQVYGTVHSSEYKKDKNEQTEANVVRIDDIFDFKRSQPLYGSFKGRMQL